MIQCCPEKGSNHLCLGQSGQLHRGSGGRLGFTGGVGIHQPEKEGEGESRWKVWLRAHGGSQGLALHQLCKLETQRQEDAFSCLWEGVCALEVKSVAGLRSSDLILLL